jgi:hypothetical protein
MSVDARPAGPSFPESCGVHSESWEECEYHCSCDGADRNGV